MAAIEALVLVVGAGFALVFVATIVVVIGIHQEERRMTLVHGAPPTGVALLTRRVLGAHYCLSPPGGDADALGAAGLFSREGEPEVLVGHGTTRR